MVFGFVFFSLTAVEKTPAHCANCNALLTGEYCCQCGERRLDREHLRLSAIIRSALEEATDFEHSKLLRTLKLLLLKPGVLTTEYLRGRRKNFVGPVKIYLTFFALSFLLFSVVRPTAIYDIHFVINADTSGALQAKFRQLIAPTHLSEAVFAEEVNSRWRRYLNLGQALYPVSIAIMFQVLYCATRRYFAEHLVFALHFASVALGINVAMWPLYVWTGVRPTAAYYVATTLLLVLIFAWLLIASRRVYGGSWLASTIKTLLVEIGYTIVGAVVVFLTLAVAIVSLVRLR